MITSNPEEILKAQEEAKAAAPTPQPITAEPPPTASTENVTNPK